MINTNNINIINNMNTLNSLNSASLTQTNNKVSETLDTAFKTLLDNESKKTQVSDSKTYDLEAIFQEASEKYNVSSDLLKAIAYNESHFKSDAVSSAGAVGIMQLMPRIAKSLGVDDPYDPYQNIMGGAKLLSQLQDMYDGNQTLMIAAYNAGCGNVAKYGGVPPFKETQNHIRKVMDTLKNGIDAPNISVKLKGNAEVPEATGIATNSNDSLYNNYDINKLFTQREYELLLEYYTKMLDIIASINSFDDDDDSSDGDNSLADLFKLSYNQQLTNNLQIAGNNSYNVETLKNRIAKQAVSMYNIQNNYDL